MSTDEQATALAKRLRESAMDEERCADSLILLAVALGVGDCDMQPAVRRRWQVLSTALATEGGCVPERILQESLVVEPSFVSSVLSFFRETAAGNAIFDSATKLQSFLAQKALRPTGPAGKSAARGLMAQASLQQWKDSNHD